MLPSREQLTSDHEPACTCHLYRLRIKTHVLNPTPCFVLSHDSGCRGSGRMGGVPTHVHMHACMHAHMHTHIKIANGHQHVYHDSGVFPVFPMSSLSSPCHPHIIPKPPFNPPTTPTPTKGGTTQISKNSITLE